MSGFIHQARFKLDHRWAPPHMSAYLDSELASRAHARMERHTDECPECRGLLHTLRRMLRMMQRLALSDTRDAPDIAAAVRQRLREPHVG